MDDLVLKTPTLQLRAGGDTVHKYSGKVRDIYDLEDELLIVSTDRLSAFDVILKSGIPNKGKILNQLSEFWFNNIGRVNHHMITTNIELILKKLDDFDILHPYYYREVFEGRSMLVKKAEPIPFECVVRGYIAGSCWEDYKKASKNPGCGFIPLYGLKYSIGMLESEKFQYPKFTPATKAGNGKHDTNVSIDVMSDEIGVVATNEIREKSISIYNRAKRFCRQRDLILADVKLEFGYINGKIVLIDELLTPDSSRFWEKSEYRPGQSQKSFDKQFVRDYLLSINYNKKTSIELPSEIVERTAEKYMEAYTRITGRTLE